MTKDLQLNFQVDEAPNQGRAQSTTKPKISESRSAKADRPSRSAKQICAAEVLIQRLRFHRF
jgi:hypothetical protein